MLSSLIKSADVIFSVR